MVCKLDMRHGLIATEFITLMLQYKAVSRGGIFFQWRTNGELRGASGNCDGSKRGNCLSYSF
jgi:hypothetical protein